MDAHERALVAEARRNVQVARALESGVWPPGSLESADELLGQALGDVAPPEPEPPPELDEDWADLLSGAPGLAGRTKWLAGSTGCDLFVKRGTEVRAPHACSVQFRSVPGGPMPIGEMLLTYPDGRAVRFRHVETRVGSSAQASQGQVVAIVNDPSMDLLRWPPGYPPPPDGYQHLDISLATSAARLNPQGGAGGDVDADAHIWAHGGVPNIRLVAHTPGPLEGSQPRHLAAWQNWVAPQVTEDLEP